MIPSKDGSWSGSDFGYFSGLFGSSGTRHDAAYGVSGSCSGYSASPSARDRFSTRKGEEVLRDGYRKRPVKGQRKVWESRERLKKGLEVILTEFGINRKKKRKLIRTLIHRCNSSPWVIFPRNEILKMIQSHTPDRSLQISRVRVFFSLKKIYL